MIFSLIFFFAQRHNNCVNKLNFLQLH